MGLGTFLIYTTVHYQLLKNHYTTNIFTSIFMLYSFINIFIFLYVLPSPLPSDIPEEYQYQSMSHLVDSG